MVDHKITGGADIDAREQIVVTDFDHTIGEQSLNETSTPLDPSLDHGSMQVSGDNVESVCKCPYPGLDNVVLVQGSGPHLLRYDGQSGKAMKEVIVSRKCAEAVLRGAQVHIWTMLLPCFLIKNT